MEPREPEDRAGDGHAARQRDGDGDAHGGGHGVTRDEKRDSRAGGPEEPYERPGGDPHDAAHAERREDRDDEAPVGSHGSPRHGPHEDPHDAALDKPCDRRRDTEETKVLRIDPASTDDAPLDGTTTPTADTADGSTAFRAPATRQDPNWRPGLLPRDPSGRPVAGPRGADPVSDDASSESWFAAPYDSAPLGPAEDAARPRTTAAPPPRRAGGPRRDFDPMAMIAGTVFMAIAVMYMLDAGDATDARPAILLALAVIGVGVSGFVGACWAVLSRRRAKAVPPPATDPRGVDLGK